MLFISPTQLVSFSRYSSFCLNFFGHVTKRLDKTHKINFECYDITAWLANSRNTYFAQYFEK